MALTARRLIAMRVYSRRRQVAPLSTRSFRMKSSTERTSTICFTARWMRACARARASACRAQRSDRLSAELKRACTASITQTLACRWRSRSSARICSRFSNRSIRCHSAAFRASSASAIDARRSALARSAASRAAARRAASLAGGGVAHASARLRSTWGRLLGMRSFAISSACRTKSLRASSSSRSVRSFSEISDATARDW